MINVQRIAKTLEEEEKRVPYAYNDHLGYLTIGIGRLIDKRRGGRLRDIEIDFLLNNDIHDAIEGLSRRLTFWYRLSDRRQEALVLMVFQLGLEGVMGFRKMLEALRNENWLEAKKQALDSKWAKEDTPERAKRVAEMFL